jgi:hypothetical protein
MILRELIEHVLHLPADLRMEAILCELIDNELLDLDQVRVRSRGIFKRGYERDVEDLEEEKDEQGHVEHLHIHLSREGLYDALPAGLFHGSSSRKYLKNTQEIREDIERQEKEERAARDFFLPIEQEFYRQRILLELKEREGLAGFGRKEGRKALLDHLWKINCESLPDGQAMALLYFLPISFVCKSDMEICQEIFQIVLQKPVELSTSFRRVRGEFRHAPELGEAYLGNTLILGNEYEEILPFLRLRILAISADEMEHHLPGRTQAVLASILCDYFLPAEAEVLVFPLLRPESSQFVLGETSGNAWLGYSTILS